MAKRWTTDELIEKVRAFQGACVIAAAAELDVFTALRGRPASASTLAERLGADPRATAVLLDALVALDLLAKPDDAYHVAPDVAELLTEDSPANVLSAIRHQANCLRRWAQLARVVKTGQPAERPPSVRGHPGDCEAFIGAMDNFSIAIAPSVIKKLSPLRFQRLLDIGGASGTWTAAFLRAVPDATAVLFDLPQVIPLARERLTNAGLIDRVTLVAGDFYTDPLPGGADFAWLSAIAHQSSRRQNRDLFAKIRAALAAGGVLAIRDVVMDASRTRPVGGALFAVNMLVGTEGGGTFTFDEFAEDLACAGFSGVRLLHRDENMNSLIVARKA
ncbi:MAG: methyltransferase domain-containing protein [Sedimentisphaerales bacterium]|nr:methyltransferase domain-containing protein [Sedimentisphaerales bacterium]